MEMKIYLKWWEKGILLLLLASPLYLTLITMSEMNGMALKKKILDNIICISKSTMESNSDTLLKANMLRYLEYIN